jgi:IMP dehydrogenase
MTDMSSTQSNDPFGFLGLTYDDVLLLPNETDVIPSEVDTTTRLTRDINIKVPLISAAMDTVTEARMAIAMARQGGIGIIHRNLSIEDQAAHVDTVKRSESGMITDPVTVGPDLTSCAASTAYPAFRWWRKTTNSSVSSPTAIYASCPQLTGPPRASARL